MWGPALVPLMLNVHTHSWRYICQPFLPLSPPILDPPKKSFNYLFQFSSKPLFHFDVISFCPWLYTMGCKVCFLVWRNITWWSKLPQYLLFQSFYSILSICIHLSLGVQSLVQSKRLVLSGSFYSLGATTEFWCSYLSVVCATFSQGNLPIATCGLSLSLLQYLFIFCASEGKREICQQSAHAYISTPLPFPFISWTYMPTLSKHTKFST